MPNISASDYTSYIKAQAASYAYRNGAIPKTIQTSAQPFTNQTVLNAQLLASKAAVLTRPAVTLVVPVSTTVSAASATTVTGAASTDGGTTVTYTTSVAHGLIAGTIITISGLAVTPAFNLANQTILAAGLTSTQFKVTNTATGTAETTSTTGRINGYVYYTTAAAHGLSGDSANLLTITGLSTTAFNLNIAKVAIVPSTTVFAIATNVTGAAVTGATGAMTLTLANSGTAITGAGRVVPYTRGYVNNPKKLSTVHNSTSTVLSSGKFPQVGGLPLTAPKWDGVYVASPHLARVDTKATGAYKAVRQPV
uniref:Uncharacterized protein n=1 Tax=viral metagenome TaxID=1070528 RepID=A0A6C0F2E0_9ZZZZ